MDTPRNNADLAADLRDDGQHEAADRIDAPAADVAGLTAAINTHAAWLAERRDYWLHEYQNCATVEPAFLVRHSVYALAAEQLAGCLEES